MHSYENFYLESDKVDCFGGLLTGWLQTPCSAGENACKSCPQGSFNLDPYAKGCSLCPQNAVCEKGAIVPEAGFWSSSLRSDQPHR